jgi:hypothetical protein
MSVMPLEPSAKYSAFKWKLFSSLFLPLVFCGSNAWAAVPAVITSTEQVLSSGYNQPQSIAVNNTNQGAIFVADTNNNQIVALVNGYPYAFNPPGFTLSTPQAIALDAKGDLFIGDTPSNNGVSYGRVIEMTADSTGNLTGAAEVFFSGAPLTNPVALAVDSSGTVFIGDYPTSGPSAGLATIYSSATVGATPTALTFTGLNSGYTPAALLRDSSNNLYIADNGNGTPGSFGGIFVAPATGGAATQVSTGSFVIQYPGGLALDSAGDLFILTMLGTNSDYQVVDVPGASPSTPYIIPSTGMGNDSGMGIDANGNLDVLDFGDGQIFQVSYLGPANLSYLNVGQAGLPLVFNFEFNAPTNLTGFKIVTQGDPSTDLTQVSGGNCAPGNYTGLSPYAPYSCFGNYEGTPKFPGIRNAAVLVQGANNTTLASAQAFEIGFAGAETTYPLTATTTATNLQQPQAVAISGLNNTVYVADTQAGVVYSTNGLSGSTLTPVSTGALALQAPTAVALDGAGDLFIADFNLGEVIEVPIGGQAPSVVIPPGGVLQHPIALTVDFHGNLYVGDAGPAGFLASSSNPGYVVMLPFGGTAYQMTLPASLNPQIVFPQALATNFYTGVLTIGDGGDPSGTGQVVGVTPDGSVGGVIPISGVTDPTGLAYDPAGALYVLDGTTSTITVDPLFNGQSAVPYLLPFNNSSLSAASALAISAGGQSFVIANIGGGFTNLVLLNGNSASLSFGNVQENTQSQSMTATEQNIGNSPLTLASPYYTTSTPTSAFNVLGSSTCGNNVVVSVGSSCSINVQFAPVFIGHTTQQLTIDSNGYNNASSVLALDGTGTN